MAAEAQTLAPMLMKSVSNLTGSGPASESVLEKEERLVLQCKRCWGLHGGCHEGNVKDGRVDVKGVKTDANAELTVETSVETAVVMALNPFLMCFTRCLRSCLPLEVKDG